MMKKLSFLFVLIAFWGFPAFGDASEQEEIDFLLFSPNSSNQFVHEAQAMIQLDTVAKYLMGRNPAAGQIYVYGYAAAVANDIDPLGLSRGRALFVINELQKRGLSKDLFADPAGQGSVDLWGSNINEEDRGPNRRVRILLDSTILTPAIARAVEPEPKAPEVVPEPVQREKSTFPWWLILLALAALAALIFFMSRRKKSPPREKIKV
ncbi:MAG: hypothetical protein FWG35_03255, partial [Spirochaetaceae bacterium]|nr:hypothetical protein [Spirochaetaceae bacterium]